MAHHQRYRRRQTGKRYFYLSEDESGKRRVVWDQLTFNETSTLNILSQYFGPNALYVPPPPCRVCGSRAEVICYPRDHSKTICPACCAKTEEGHDFVYEPGAGHECTFCGLPRSSARAIDYDYD